MRETENRKMLILFGVIVTALLVILISILGLHVSAVPVCFIVLIEAAMAQCLREVPIWLHGLVVLAQIIVGALVSNLVFISLCAVIYLVGILAPGLVKN
ncbi:MAG: hypothetical protein ACLT3H_09610 [Roseburia sp.]